MEENGLKQRLVGAIVLVALAVIFIPMFLGGGGQSGLTMLRTNIPPDTVGIPQDASMGLAQLPEGPAPMPPRAVPLAVEPAALEKPPAPPPAASPAGRPASSPVAGQAAAMPAPDKTPAGPDTPPKAWVVQLASFEREANARALRDRLLAKHHHAFVEPVQTSSGTIYRVRVGPEVRREAAERLRDALQRETRLKGLVVSHP